MSVAEGDGVEAFGVYLHALHIFQQGDWTDSCIPQDTAFAVVDVQHSGEAMFRQEGFLVEIFYGLAGLQEQVGAVVHQDGDGDGARRAKIGKRRHSVTFGSEGGENMAHCVL